MKIYHCDVLRKDVDNDGCYTCYMSRNELKRPLSRVLCKRVNLKEKVYKEISDGGEATGIEGVGLHAENSNPEHRETKRDRIHENPRSQKQKANAKTKKAIHKRSYAGTSK